MKFSIITLFPDIISTYCKTSIIGRAESAGIININMVNPRNFTEDVHRKVDDEPYGGGPGMVMMCQPVIDSYESILPVKNPCKVLITSPSGERFSQQKAIEFAKLNQLVIICGHYEGIDARIQELIPDIELVSVGDFVLTGGELAALCIIDATSRFLPGVLGKKTSLNEESFTDGLLEYPHYTRPAEFRGLKVPSVLLSGNHAEISRWRRKMSLGATLRQRPDMLDRCSLSSLDKLLLSEIIEEYNETGQKIERKC